LTVKYGKTKEDDKADKSLQCREIVLEINKFGVDESQKLQIIKLIALSLDNNLNMKKIVNTVSKIVENNQENNDKSLIGI
jgi:hypothetical protein